MAPPATSFENPNLAKEDIQELLVILNPSGLDVIQEAYNRTVKAGRLVQGYLDSSIVSFPDEDPKSFSDFAEDIRLFMHTALRNPQLAGDMLNSRPHLTVHFPDTESLKNEENVSLIFTSSEIPNVVMMLYRSRKDNDSPKAVIYQVNEGFSEQTKKALMVLFCDSDDKEFFVKEAGKGYKSINAAIEIDLVSGDPSVLFINPGHR